MLTECQTTNNKATRVLNKPLQQSEKRTERQSISQEGEPSVAWIVQRIWREMGGGWGCGVKEFRSEIIIVVVH
jgi:hypothetical protein